MLNNNDIKKIRQLLRDKNEIEKEIVSIIELGIDQNQEKILSIVMEWTTSKLPELTPEEYTTIEKQCNGFPLGYFPPGEEALDDLLNQITSLHFPLCEKLGIIVCDGKNYISPFADRFIQAIFSENKEQYLPNNDQLTQIFSGFSDLQTKIYHDIVMIEGHTFRNGDTRTKIIRSRL